MRGSGSSLTVFASLWSAGVFLDLCTHAAWFHSPLHALLALACLAVLVRPASGAPFAVLNGLVLAVFARETPDTPNHHVLFAVAGATLLVSLAASCAARRSPRIDREAWLAIAAPALRVELVVLYFFAVLHKLNWDYFDTKVSCAVAIARYIEMVFCQG